MSDSDHSAPDPTPVILISGSDASEETALALAVSKCLENKNITHMWTQKDHLDCFRPKSSIPDIQRHAWIGNLASVWANYRDRGCAAIVLNGSQVVELQSTIEGSLEVAHMSDDEVIEEGNELHPFAFYGFALDYEEQDDSAAAEDEGPLRKKRKLTTPKGFWAHFEHVDVNGKDKESIARRMVDMVKFGVK